MLSSQFNELQVNTADNNAASEHDRSISSMSSAPLSPFMSNPSAFSDDYQPQRRGNINLTCSHEACLVCEYFDFTFYIQKFQMDLLQSGVRLQNHRQVRSAVGWSQLPFQSRLFLLPLLLQLLRPKRCLHRRLQLARNLNNLFLLY